MMISGKENDNESPPILISHSNSVVLASAAMPSFVGEGVGLNIIDNAGCLLVGANDGSKVGSNVGSKLGCTVGSCVGTTLGCKVGSCDGPIVGSAEGTDDGSTVGLKVGFDVGSKVGFCV